MLLRTHLTVTFFGILILVPRVEHKVIFVVLAVIATYIPDIDSRYSSIGRKRINRILQFFTKHRGFTHSFIFLFIITGILLLVYPIAALGVFLGYSLHLFADSFTKDGITPFYPFAGFKSSGNISTGGRAEIFVFVMFLVADLVLFLNRFIL